MAVRGYRTIKLALPRTKRNVDVYTGTLYDGVRLSQVMEAVYLQGKKDGALEVFDELDREISTAKSLIPHKRPGRPRKTAARKPVQRKPARRKAARRKAARRN